MNEYSIFASEGKLRIKIQVVGGTIKNHNSVGRTVGQFPSEGILRIKIKSRRRNNQNSVGLKN